MLNFFYLSPFKSKSSLAFLFLELENTGSFSKLRPATATVRLAMVEEGEVEGQNENVDNEYDAIIMIEIRQYNGMKGGGKWRWRRVESSKKERAGERCNKAKSKASKVKKVATNLELRRRGAPVSSPDNPSPPPRAMQS